MDINWLPVIIILIVVAAFGFRSYLEKRKRDRKTNTSQSRWSDRR